MAQTTPDEPMFPAVADPLPPRPETTLGRPLLWAAAWGGLGALLAATAALIVMFLFLMAFLALIAGASDTTTLGDVFGGTISGLATLPFTPEVMNFALRICTISAVLSMGALLLLRLHPAVRRWKPSIQGLAATGATYALFSATASALGAIAQSLLAYW